jgi:hypothetical protein
LPTRLARGGHEGQSAGETRAAIIADTLDLIEHGRLDGGRRLLREHLCGLPAEERCPFLAVAATELFRGRPHVAVRHLRAALERGL